MNTKDKDDKVSVCFVFFFSEGEVCCSTGCTREGKNLAHASQHRAFPYVRALCRFKWGCCSKGSRFLTLSLTHCTTQEEGSMICFVFLSSPLIVSLISQGLSLCDSLRALWSELYCVGTVILHAIFIIALRYS